MTKKYRFFICKFLLHVFKNIYKTIKRYKILLFKKYFSLTYFHNKKKQKLFSFINGNDYVFFLQY